MKAAAELALHLGEITFPEGRVDIKHLSVEWGSSLSAEEYSDEYGEALYMELQHNEACIPLPARGDVIRMGFWQR